MSHTTQKTAIGIDGATAASFWRRTERKARFTALGVAVLIAACGIAAIVSGYAGNLAGGLYLLATAMGVMLIITPYLGRRSAHHHRRVPIAQATRTLARREYDAYQRHQRIGMVFGIGMCIAALAPAAIIDNNLGGGLFMFGEAIGVFFLIYVNQVAAGYKKLTRKYAKLR